jgi:hypothetical protein
VEAKREIHLGASKVAPKRRIPETRREASRRLPANVDTEKRLRTYILLFSVFCCIFGIKAYVGCCMYFDGGSEACASRVGRGDKSPKKGPFWRTLPPIRTGFTSKSRPLLYVPILNKVYVQKDERRKYYTQKTTKSYLAATERIIRVFAAFFLRLWLSFDASLMQERRRSGREAIV